MGLDDTTRLSYLDSSVVIDLLDPQAPRHQAVRSGIRQAKNDVLCVSDLVRLEVSVGPFTRKIQSEFDRLNTVLRGLTRLEMPEDVYIVAARLRADHGLKTADALHIATAQHHDCREFWTNDLRLTKLMVGLTFRTFSTL